jgi:hypothetical protein
MLWLFLRFSETAHWINDTLLATRMISVLIFSRYYFILLFHIISWITSAFDIFTSLFLYYYFKTRTPNSLIPYMCIFKAIDNDVHNLYIILYIIISYHFMNHIRFWNFHIIILYYYFKTWTPNSIIRCMCIFKAIDNDVHNLCIILFW